MHVRCEPKILLTTKDAETTKITQNIIQPYKPKTHFNVERLGYRLSTQGTHNALGWEYALPAIHKTQSIGQAHGSVRMGVTHLVGVTRLAVNH